MYNIEMEWNDWMIKEQKLYDIVSCNVEFERLMNAMNKGLTFILDRNVQIPS
jgi:hypothetical protein